MKLLTLLVALAMAALLGSCNTMIGMSRDIKIFGSEMENTATKAKTGSGGGDTGEGDTSGAPIY
jgi:predicted small secreted protein